MLRGEPRGVVFGESICLDSKYIPSARANEPSRTFCTICEKNKYNWWIRSFGKMAYRSVLYAVRHQCVVNSVARHKFHGAHLPPVLAGCLAAVTEAPQWLLCWKIFGCQKRTLNMQSTVQCRNAPVVDLCSAAGQKPTPSIATHWGL